MKKPKKKKLLIPDVKKRRGPLSVETREKISAALLARREPKVLDDVGRKQIELEILKIKEQEETIKNQIKAYEDTHQIEYIVPYWYQSKVTELFRTGKNIVIMPLSNKTGKTTIGACLVHSWAKGYEPWNPVPDTFEGAVRAVVRGKEGFFMPSSLGKFPPVHIRITGYDWEEHLKRTIVPELKKWALPDEYTTTKNNTGVEASWTHKKTGSTFNLMTYSQDPEAYEAFKGNGWWPDEPPPEDVWSAMSRGLFMTGGKIFMSMTPLKEPWIWDTLVRSARPDIGIIKGVDLWDCPHLYDHDLNVLMKCGMTGDESREWLMFQKEEAKTGKKMLDSEKLLKEKLGNHTVKFQDEFGRTTDMDALTFAFQELHIHRFIKDLKDDNERMPRVFGIPKHLMGLIIKGYDKDIHVIDPFKVPTDWPVTPIIDLHLSTPQALSFFAVDPPGNHYVIDEIWEHLSPEQIADEIIRRKTSNAWDIDTAFIDPLSKGDSAYVKNRGMEVEDSFSIIERKLSEHSIQLISASKDKKSGILNITNWLCGINGKPTLFFFRSLQSATDGIYGTLFEITRWVYDEDGIPAKKDDHFMENLYRYTLAGVEYNGSRGKYYHQQDNRAHGSLAWMGN